MTRIHPGLCRCLVAGLLLLPLAGCEWLGIDDPAKLAAAKEAEGKAVGSACRHAQRAIEDCYTLNPKAQKAAVFAGWREMDEYMRENKLEGIAPVVPRPGTARRANEEDADAEAGAGVKADDKGAEKSPDKGADKGSGKPADKSSDKSASADRSGSRAGAKNDH